MSLLANITGYRPFRYSGEAVACNLCGGAGKSVIARRDRWLNPLTNVICTHCGLIRVDPMPTNAELERYYTDHYRLHYQSTLEPTPKTISRGRKSAVERFDILQEYVKPGARVLDIGAGGGEFLAEAKARGYEAEGIEPSTGFARYAERSYGVKVHVAPLMKIDFGARKFDLIHSFHVFEHLRDPMASMQRVHSLLAPGGIFFIAVPNMAEKRTPTGMFHFAHVHGFAFETLHMMAAKAGFELIPRESRRAAQVFRKVDAPDAGWYRYPNHAKEMEQKFRDSSLAKHLLSGAPYRRAFARLKRKLGERKLKQPA